MVMTGFLQKFIPVTFREQSMLGSNKATFQQGTILMSVKEETQSNFPSWAAPVILLQ